LCCIYVKKTMRETQRLPSLGDLKPLLSPYPETKQAKEGQGTWQELITLWFHQYVVTPAAELEAHEISLSVSIGLWGGVLPVPALTTVATILLAAILHVSSTQKALAFTFNMLATPLQLLTMPSFIIMGNYLFRDSTCDPLTLLATFSDPNVTFFTAIGNSSACLCAGAVVWAILGVPVVYLLTVSLAYLIRVRQEKLALIKIK